MADTATAPVVGPSTRPPARPGTRQSSRHHLEPNPFEQSFSSKPSGSETSSPQDGEGGGDETTSSEASGKKRKARVNADRNGQEKQAEEATVTSSKEETGSVKAAPRPAALTVKPDGAEQQRDAQRLPSLSALASPAGDGHSSFSHWPSSLGSLRAGPLSPAMLAGPAASGPSGFDASAFRTGFTPDLSNFKTGLTPLGGPASFPPPSPGTAAFLAMITHGSGAGGGLTPGTLSALAGQGTNNVDGSSNVTANREGDPFDLTFQRHHAQSHQPTSRLRMTSEAEGTSATSVSPEITQRPLPGATDKSPKRSDKKKQQQQQQQQPPVASAQQAQHQQHMQQQQQNAQPQQAAASGLFLLSQAHQELAKREEDQAAVAAAHALAGSASGGVAQVSQFAPHLLYESQQQQQQYQPRQQQHVANAAPAAPPAKKAGAAKRKKSDAPPATAAPAAKRGKKQKTPRSEAGSEMGGPSDDEMDGGGGGQSQNGDGDMDDEEKRKNFLERNRQAALKCRQRKKAWLQQLQQRAEMLQTDNEHLRDSLGAMRSEVAFLKSQLMSAHAQLAGAGINVAQPSNAMPSVPVPAPQRAASNGAPAVAPMLPPGVPLPSGMSMGMQQHSVPAFQQQAHVQSAPYPAQHQAQRAKAEA